MDPFGLDDTKNDTQAEPFTAAAGTFKTAFTGDSFDDIDDLKPAPSDELMADAAAAAASDPLPPSEQQGTAPSTPTETPASVEPPKDEGVLVSSS